MTVTYKGYEKCEMSMYVSQFQLDAHLRSVELLVSRKFNVCCLLVVGLADGRSTYNQD